MDFTQYFENPHIDLFSRQKEVIGELVLEQYGLLRGDQGVGKTVCSVFLIKIWLALNLVQKVLIITRPIVIKKFKFELLKYIDDLSEDEIILFDKKNRDFFNNPKGCIFLCDYDQIKLAAKHLGAAGIRKRGNKTYKVYKDAFKLDNTWACILDEIQVCKNQSSDVHKIVFKNTQNVRACIGSTGTPVEKVEDLWAIFRIIDPSIISYNYFTFMHKIAELMGDTLRVAHYKEGGVKEVWDRVNPHIKQLYQSDVVSPVLKEIFDKYTDMDEEFLRGYQWYKEGLRKELFRDGYFSKKTAATLIHPLFRYIKRVSMDNPRFALFNKIFMRLVPTEKVVVWDGSPDTLKDLQKWYAIKGIKSKAIYGDVPQKDRLGLIEEFDKDPEVRALFISYLTNSDAWEIPSRSDLKRAIYYSLPDRAINYDQSLYRLHRINSESPIMIYRIFMRGTIDDWAVSLIDYKMKLMKGLITQEAFQVIEEASLARLWGVGTAKVLD